MQAHTASDMTTNLSVPLSNYEPIQYTDEQVIQLSAALAEPFDPREIKWRVTNTTQDRKRGQVVAYADPRAYTDRLSDVFTVRGWTRDYWVQVAQNFERSERGSSERTISGKIVVTCKLSIHGLGAHSGLGEEWADNENAGTSAEAQAFKRACSCFGLGRYLYDLDGTWVDLDERKQPRSTPKLPDWAIPKHNANGSARSAKTESAPVQQPPSNQRPADLKTLQDQVNTLCGQVGFSLARSIAQTAAGSNDFQRVQDPTVLSLAVEKLQDLARGLQRLHAAIQAGGTRKYADLCRELNLAGDSIDDIPNRAVLKRLIETLERQAAASSQGEAPEAGERRAASSGDARTNGHPAAPASESPRRNGAPSRR